MSEARQSDRQRDDGLRALRLILPLAKAYAAQHQVGSNAEYIAQAEAVLMSDLPEQQEKVGASDEI